MIAGADAGASLQLKDGDRIVLVGGTLIEREQRYGFWEAALTLLHPELNLTFRNLGWSGDTVYGDARAGFGTTADGYRLLKEQITATKPTVLLIAYGGNEAFDGEAGLPRFREGMQRFLSDLASLHARIVLLAPMEHERSPVNANQNIRLYRKAIEELAREQHVGFGDVFAGTRDTPQAVRSKWTDDGIHLNAEGYRRMAPGFCRLFVGPKPYEEFEFKLPAKGIEPPALFNIDPVDLARSTENRVTISGLAPGRYKLVFSENLEKRLIATIDTTTDAEWGKGKVVRLDVPNGKFDSVRKAIVAKNVLYFNRYRPENETYLFGFRKHEQGQNAGEVPEFDKLVAEAETRIGGLRKPVLSAFLVIRVDQ
jgi:lysophospholipase L1-like esterase